MREKQKCEWEARNSMSYWYKLILTYRCNVSVSRASTLRDRSVYVGAELVQFQISLLWLSHTLTSIHITYKFGISNRTELRSDEGLMLETSAFEVVMVANLHFQLS